mmetsp:Transcript_26766/g.85936  ORF Transcript_26766/g.85936 Transcript_26766/m.85936 type:complete len:568 (+) Transcript_26766:63-1766(+)
MSGSALLNAAPAAAARARAGAQGQRHGNGCGAPALYTRGLSSSGSSFSGARVSAVFPQSNSSARRSLVVKAESEEQESGTTRIRRKREEQKKEDLSIDDFNPIKVGRSSREKFDNVWRALVRLGQPTMTSSVDDFMMEDDRAFIDNSAYETPQAAYTTVLVVGATGRIGKVLVRKLLLRGYTVKALVRKADKESSTSAGSSYLDPSRSKADILPKAVKVIEGSVGDLAAVQEAMKDVDKVVCCTGTKSTLTMELEIVEKQGIANLTRAFLETKHRLSMKLGNTRSNQTKLTLFKFGKPAHFDKWETEVVGLPAGTAAAAMPRSRAAFTATTRVDFDVREKAAFFGGAVYEKGGIAQIGADITTPGSEGFKGYEGLVLRVLGDGKAYTAELRAANGQLHVCRFNTKIGWSTIRLPFNSFRPLNPEHPPMDVRAVDHISLRFETRRQRSAGAGAGEGSENRFALSVDFIKAMPAGDEPDVVLVSCTGLTEDNEDARARLVSYKRAGEQILRNSGVSYSIVRPGKLLEEPGGTRALVFDQGDRIVQGIRSVTIRYTGTPQLILYGLWSRV